MKDIILLGSTGSVGKSVLDVVRHYPDKFRIKGLASKENVSVLSEQIEEFSPEFAAIANEDLYSDLKSGTGVDTEVLAGAESLEKMAALGSSDTVFIAIAGTAALNPLIAALKAGKTVALASKEPVVSAGVLIRQYVEEYSSTILPVDSEHSAIMQCLSGRRSSDVRTLYITGSGGSLKDVDKEDFDSLSVEQVLDHPKWDMGAKITVDSATLMNKGLEVIEARWLFDVPQEKIEVVMHPEAAVHAVVEFMDGTMSASMFYPDMRFPVLRALAYPDILESDFPRVDLNKLKTLSFSAPDTDKFPALQLAFDSLDAGGTVPAVLNSANETSVKLFLDNKIRFTDIIETVEKVIKKHKKIESPSLQDIIDAEKWATEEVLRFC